VKKKNINKIALTFFLLVGGFFVLATVFGTMYRGRIYPGVSMAGINMGGATREQALVALDIKLKEKLPIVLEHGGEMWTISLFDVLGKIDFQKSIDEAFGIGRNENPVLNAKVVIATLFSGRQIEPVINFDSFLLHQSMASISAEIDVPAKEPEITYDSESKRVIVSAGENGYRTEQEKLENLIWEQWKTGKREELFIPVKELKPKLTDFEVGNTLRRATSLLEKRLKIAVPDSSEQWTLVNEQILAWLDAPGGGWNKQKIHEWVAELAKGLNREPQNSSFRFVSPGRVEEFRPSKNGLQILVDESTDQILSGLSKMEAENKNTEIELIIKEVPPEISTAQANNLGIKELLGRGESWFTGSIDNRIFNLNKSAEIISGTLVAPGEIFSLNKVVGEISAATGYKPAYIIKEGKTILGDGGGVCQTSSTLFRAVLKSGLPIQERVAHAYRVGYYEQKSPPGFDATVFQPQPDFKFANDTPSYLLVQSVFDATKKYLAIDIFGTSDGRVATTSAVRIWDATPPPPDLYQDDPSLPAGTVKQIEHSSWGAKVAFDWKVTRGEEVLQQRTFFSNYVPWQAVYLKGTKP
jgi:vancomycin resistance protein YoaR